MIYIYTMNVIMTPKKIKLARQLRLEGKSPREIASILEVKLKRIYQYTANLGVPPCHPLYKTKEIQHDFFSKTNVRHNISRLVLVGFVAADGCISESKGQKTLIIRLAKKDVSVLQTFNVLLAKNTRTISEAKKSKAIDFPSDLMCNDLAHYGIVPRKTSIYTWPKHLTKNQGQRFLLGYFYGDGCFHRYPNRDSISFVTTMKFAEELRKFLYRHKIVEHCVISQYKKRPIYTQVVLQGKHCRRFAKWLFADLSMPLLPRKHPPS